MRITNRTADYKVNIAWILDCDTDSQQTNSDTDGVFDTIGDRSNAAFRVYHHCKDHGTRLDKIKNATSAAHSLARVKRCPQCPEITEPWTMIRTDDKFTGLCGGRNFGRKSLAADLGAQIRRLEPRRAYIDDILKEIYDDWVADPSLRERSHEPLKLSNQ